MASAWSRGNSTTITNISLKNVATGIIYESLKTDGSYKGINYNNLSRLTDPVGTAPNGLYEITQDFAPTASHNHAYFWLTSTGATIAWNQNKYYSDETAISTWSVTPAYWDTATYSYTGAIVDAYGTAKKTWTISAASGSESTTLDTTTYPMGVYYNKITATLKASPFTAYILDTDYTEVTQDIRLNGITYNATTATPLPFVLINFTQSGTVTNTTSFPVTATYNKTGFVSSSAITIEPNNKLGQQGALLWVPVSFTPLSYGNFTINLYGTETVANTSIHHPNATIYGLVQSYPYYNGLSPALVQIWNDTQYTSFYTNETGYYNFTGLLPLSEYTMNASFTGYTTSTNDVVNSTSYIGTIQYNATRKDFLLNTLYTITINFVDADTGSPIPAVTVTDSDGYTETTTTGTYTHSYPYSLVAFYFTATGYTGASTSYVMDEDRTETVRLTASSTPVSNIFYTPWQVRIQIVDYYQNPLPGTNVTAYYVASTLPSTDISWLINAFAISSTVAGDMTNSALAMAGQTDDNGGLSFTMFKSIAYNLNIVNTTIGVNVNKTLYPSDQEYRIRVPLASQIPLNNTLSQMADTQLPVYQLNASCYNLSWIYSDTSGLTTNVLFQVIGRNGTIVYNNDMGNPGIDTLADNFTVCHQAMGSELLWQYSATRSGT